MPVGSKPCVNGIAAVKRMVLPASRAALPVSASSKDIPESINCTLVAKRDEQREATPHLMGQYCSHLFDKDEVVQSAFGLDLERSVRFELVSAM